MAKQPQGDPSRPAGAARHSERIEVHGVVTLQSTEPGVLELFVPHETWAEAALVIIDTITGEANATVAVCCRNRRRSICPDLVSFSSNSCPLILS